MTQFATATQSFAPMGSPGAEEPGGMDADGSSLATLTPAFVRRKVQHGRDKLRWARAQRKRGAELTLGQHYGTDPTDQTDRDARAGERRKRQPVNLGAQQLRTLLWYLTYSAGEPEITAKFSDDELHATILNKLAEEDFQHIKLVDTLQAGLIDCFLGGLGIFKQGVKAGSKVFADGTTTLDPGDFYTTVVSLDDFVTDPLARWFWEAIFNGYRTRISRSASIRANLYGRDPQELEPDVAANPHIATRAEAQAMLRGVQHLTSAGGRADNVADLSGQASQADSDTDLIEVWELEWKIDGRMYSIVLPANPGTGDIDESSDKFLLIEPCADEKEGSLRILSVLPAVDNLVPQSLEQVQRDLSITADAIARKITRAAIEAKKGLGYAPSEEDAMINIKKASDNFLVKCDPTKIKEFSISGMVEEPMQAMGFVMQHWNNVAAQAGAAAGDTKNTTDTKTLGEIQNNVAKAQGWIQYLTLRIEAVVGQIFGSWARYKLADASLQQQIPYPLGDGMTMPLNVNIAMLHNGDQDFTLTPQMASERAAQFIYRIRSTSMRPMDPAMEGNQIIQFIATALTPMVNAIAQGILKPGSIRLVLRKLGVREADQIVNDMEMLAQQQQLRMMGPPGMWGGQPDMPQPQQPGQQQPGMGGPPGAAPGGPPRPPGGGAGGPGPKMPATPGAMRQSVAAKGRPQPVGAAA